MAWWWAELELMNAPSYSQAGRVAADCGRVLGVAPTGERRRRRPRGLAWYLRCMSAAFKEELRLERKARAWATALRPIVGG